MSEFVRIGKTEDRLLMEFIEILKSDNSKKVYTKKEVLGKMISYCSVNSVDIYKEERTNNFSKKISDLENKLLERINQIPIDVKKNDSFDGNIYTQYDEMFSCLLIVLDYIKRNKDFDNFLNTLNEKQLEFLGKNLKLF